ncbi:hypothetical protein GA0074692_6765 [Micromonospora pallida]|uniref:Uncharacterized protein n=1 Tax=Micromonospora pallida TaxID=145854 RepID=A0A1C6TN87_9ACTN|nr:hypothetical protein [Micromonospora pallida]SCL43208.1 hypothetical protein GA0074692_6765 [Micromonospora pallida]
MTARRRPARPSIRPHPLVPDPDIGLDHADRPTCKTCRMVGRVGDSRHPDPTAPPRQLPAALAQAAQELDAAILGEREDPW